MTPICLHVGYHKCASTTLQKNFFANHPQIQQLGKDAGFEDADRAVKLATDLVRNDSTVACENALAEAARMWRQAESKARAVGRLPLFSWENLTRDFFFRTPTDERLPRMLKAVVGEARIVIVVRHQIRLLESLYLSRIKPPNYLTPEQWFDAEGSRAANAYCYADVISTYQSIFGHENVFVILFEEIISNSDGIAQKLCEFIGVDPLTPSLLSGPAKNSRPSAVIHTYARLRRRVLPGVSLGRLIPEAWVGESYRFMSKGKRSEIVFAPERVSALEEVYRLQNRRLMERFGLDLERFGYPL